MMTAYVVDGEKSQLRHMLARGMVRESSAYQGVARRVALILIDTSARFSRSSISPE